MIESHILRSAVNFYEKKLARSSEFNEYVYMPAPETPPRVQDVSDLG